MNSTREITGRMIRKIRNEKKITQQELADMLGVDRQYIWRLENGRINFTMDYLDKVIKKLGYSYPDFMRTYFKT